MTELIETCFDVSLVQIALDLELVRDLVNPGAGEPDREVNIEDVMLFTDSDRLSLIYNIYKVVRVSDKIKIYQLVLDNIAPLIARPLFRRDDHVICFEGLN